MNASGFSSDYISIGPNAYELTAGQATVSLNVRSKVSISNNTSESMDNFDDIENGSPNDKIHTITRVEKRKNHSDLTIDDDGETGSRDWLDANTSKDSRSIPANKKQKSNTSQTTAISSRLHIPDYTKPSAEISGVSKHNDNGLTASRKSHKPTVYSIDESDDSQGEHEELFISESRLNKTNNTRQTSRKRPIQNNSSTPLEALEPSVGPALLETAKPNRKKLLSRQQKSAFQNWLFSYRKLWPMYWNYMDDIVVKHIVNEIPLSTSDLNKIPKFGQAKVMRYGEHILATIWAFLNRNNLSDLFGDDLKKPTIPDCPTWLDPDSQEAEDIRRKGNSHSLGNANGGSSKSGNTTTTASSSGSGVVTLNTSATPHKTMVASPGPSSTCQIGKSNIYSPTDHSLSGYSSLADIYKQSQDGIVDNNTTGGFRSHSLISSISDIETPSSRHAASPTGNLHSTMQVSPRWVSARVPVPTILPSAESIYGKKKEQNESAMYSMEY